MLGRFKFPLSAPAVLSTQPHSHCNTCWVLIFLNFVELQATYSMQTPGTQRTFPILLLEIYFSNFFYKARESAGYSPKRMVTIVQSKLHLVFMYITLLSWKLLTTPCKDLCYKSSQIMQFSVYKEKEIKIEYLGMHDEEIGIFVWSQF